MSETGKQRRTQAQRRAESRQAVLDSATRLFGERGYARTSLEDIAQDSGLTIRPVYHYFGNKKALFAAVNDEMEQRLLDSIHISEDARASSEQSWHSFLNLCDDPAFRRIVLIDSPAILGRDRWSTSPVMQKARMAFNGERHDAGQASFRDELLSRVMVSAFTEIALAIAEADDIGSVRRDAEALVAILFSRLRGEASDRISDHTR